MKTEGRDFYRYGWNRRHEDNGGSDDRKGYSDNNKKYEYYLSSDIDIELSGFEKVYFIEFDKNGECNSFYIAKGTDELERIIKMNIYENMECIIDVTAEDVEHQIQCYELNLVELLNSIGLWRKAANIGR